MREIIFVVERASEGGLSAHALGEPIFTQADNVADLHACVRDALRCHFDEGKAPKMIRLRFVQDALRKKRYLNDCTGAPLAENEPAEAIMQAKALLARLNAHLRERHAHLVR